MAEAGDPTAEGVTLDTSVAHPARVYDYWLGGKDSFAADREAAEQVIAWGIVGHVLELLPPGSYLTVSDTVRDIDTGRVTEGTARLNQRMGPTQLTLRTRPDFERFFDGLEMVEPGVVPLPEWHGPGSEYPIPCYAGMGRKP
jgi:hypothetical protein